MSRNLYNLIKQGYDTYFEIDKQLDDIAMFLRKYYKKHPRKLTNEVLQDNLLNLKLHCFDSKPISRAVQEIYTKGIAQKKRQGLPFSRVQHLNGSLCMPSFRNSTTSYYTHLLNVNNCVFAFSLKISKHKQEDFYINASKVEKQYIVTDKALVDVLYESFISNQLAEKLARDIVQKLEKIPAINRKLARIAVLQKRLVRYLLWYERLLVFGLKKYVKARFNSFKSEYVIKFHYEASTGIIEFNCPKYAKRGYSYTSSATFKISKQATLKQFLQHIQQRKTNDI